MVALVETIKARADGDGEAFAALVQWRTAHRIIGGARQDEAAALGRAGLRDIS